MYQVIKELLYITSDKILKTCVNWKLKYRDQIGKTVLTNPLPVNSSNDSLKGQQYREKKLIDIP